MIGRLTTLLAIAWFGFACAKPAGVEVKEQPPSRLVGTWEQDLSLDPKLAKYLERARERSGEAARPASGGGTPLRLTFSENGEYTMEGAIFEHPIKETCRWRVVQEGPAQVTVELLEPDKPASSATFKFQSPDVIVVQWTARSESSYLRRLR